MNHPSKEIVGTSGKELMGKRIALCVTGSVAAAYAPEIARLLMRHGAEVYPVMTSMAQKIIHPNLMLWATGNAVTIELTGKIEHIALAGSVPGRVDLVLVAPATANTISKIACGIDDTTVTSVVSTAFGSHVPIVIVPAMHESMYNHPVLKRNIDKLRGLGVEFVGPKIEEGKAKIAETREIVSAVIDKLTFTRDFSGLTILITAGSTIEYIDPVRIITNKSSGKMGVALAEEALSRGADVTMIYGQGNATPPSDAHVVRVETTKQMHEAVVSELKQRKYDLIIAAAAVADWTPEKPCSYKISTHKLDAFDMRLKPTVKIIDELKGVSPKTFLIAFRAEYKIPKKTLIESGYERLVKAKADLIVINDVGKNKVGFNVDTNEVFIVDKMKNVIHVPLSAKREVARRILDVAKQKMKTH